MYSEVIAQNNVCRSKLHLYIYPNLTDYDFGSSKL